MVLWILNYLSACFFAFYFIFLNHCIYGFVWSLCQCIQPLCLEKWMQIFIFKEAVLCTLQSCRKSEKLQSDLWAPIKRPKEEKHSFAAALRHDPCQICLYHIQLLLAGLHISVIQQFIAQNLNSTWTQFSWAVQPGLVRRTPTGIHMVQVLTFMIGLNWICYYERENSIP